MGQPECYPQLRGVYIIVGENTGHIVPRHRLEPNGLPDTNDGVIVDGPTGVPCLFASGLLPRIGISSTNDNAVLPRFQVGSDGQLNWGIAALVAPHMMAIDVNVRTIVTGTDVQQNIGELLILV